MLKLSEYIPTGIFLKCKWKGKFTKETSMKRNKYKNYDEKRKLTMSERQHFIKMEIKKLGS